MFFHTVNWSLFPVVIRILILLILNCINIIAVAILLVSQLKIYLYTPILVLPNGLVAPFNSEQWLGHGHDSRGTGHCPSTCAQSHFKFAAIQTALRRVVAHKETRETVQRSRPRRTAIQARASAVQAAQRQLI